MEKLWVYDKIKINRHVFLFFKTKKIPCVFSSKRRFFKALEKIQFLTTTLVHMNPLYVFYTDNTLNIFVQRSLVESDHQNINFIVSPPALWCSTVINFKSETYILFDMFTNRLEQKKCWPCANEKMNLFYEYFLVIIRLPLHNEKRVQNVK